MSKSGVVQKVTQTANTKMNHLVTHSILLPSHLITLCEAEEWQMCFTFLNSLLREIRASQNWVNGKYSFLFLL